jgi:protease II
VSERSDGLSKIRIIPWNGEEYYLPFESETYTPTSNVDFDDILRYAYQSMATPASIIDFNMKTREKVIRKEQEVLGGSFDKDNYIEERVWAAKMELRCLFLWFIKRSEKMGKPIIALCLWFIWSFHGCLFFINKIILTRQRFCLCHCAHSRW